MDLHSSGRASRYVTKRAERQHVAPGLDSDPDSTPFSLSWEGDCVIWNRKTRKDGYPVIVRNGKQKLAHRILWIEAGRTMPTGHELHHLCNQRSCVNLNHLVAVTHAEHMRLHRYSACPRCRSNDIYTSPTDKRYCRPCYNEWKRVRRSHA